MQIIADLSKILKTVQREVIFILNVLLESNINFIKFSIVLAKRKNYWNLYCFVSFTKKVIFIENEAVLLCVTIREHARAFVATI